jgi:hypothetical protein
MYDGECQPSERTALSAKGAHRNVSEGRASHCQEGSASHCQRREHTALSAKGAHRAVSEVGAPHCQANTREADTCIGPHAWPGVTPSNSVHLNSKGELCTNFWPTMSAPHPVESQPCRPTKITPVSPRKWWLLRGAGCWRGHQPHLVESPPARPNRTAPSHPGSGGCERENLGLIDQTRPSSLPTA